MLENDYEKNIERDIKYIQLFTTNKNQMVVTPKELSMIISKSEITLYRERKKGIGIPFIQRNGKIVYPIREVAIWLNSTIKTA